MTAVPGHLLDIARHADQATGPGRAQLVRNAADAILLCLPPEDPHACLGRLVAAEAEMHPSVATQRKARVR